MFQQVKAIKNPDDKESEKDGKGGYANGSGDSGDVFEGQADTGGSDKFNYGYVEKLESHARLVRFDQ